MPKTPVKLAAYASYDVHPSVKLMQDWVAGLKAKTGRAVDEWVSFIQRSGPKAEEARREWLRTEHGLGTNSAWWLAERADGRGGEDDDPESYLRTAAQYVEDMYSGAKGGLRPIHDTIIKAARKLGKEVKVCPCKTILPIFRNHVVAQIKPSTKTRIDLGFALGDRNATGRLIDTGGFAKKDRITHRIPITHIEEVDEEVSQWLKTAFDRDA